MVIMGSTSDLFSCSLSWGPDDKPGPLSWTDVNEYKFEPAALGG